MQRDVLTYDPVYLSHLPHAFPYVVASYVLAAMAPILRAHDALADSRSSCGSRSSSNVRRDDHTYGQDLPLGHNLPILYHMDML